MKHNSFSSKDRVPWLKYVLLLFVLLFLSVAERVFSQDYIPSNRFQVNSPLPLTYLRLNEVNRNASRHFRDHFLSNGREKWIKEDGFYIAIFSDPILLNKAYYNVHGAFQFCMKSYGGDGLNEQVKATVFKKFKGFQIITVMEISNLENVVYYIKIVSPTKIKTLKCYDGMIEVTEDYINGGL
ncbi:MAG TPA: hypothetical protein VNV85_03050 [Puia sp.]|jgi:hypothetical protein|nr:hypothetical protein [Puia sp.]